MSCDRRERTLLSHTHNSLANTLSSKGIRLLASQASHFGRGTLNQFCIDRTGPCMCALAWMRSYSTWALCVVEDMTLIL